MTDTIQSTSATPAGDVRARNKDILFAALAQAGISKVSIEFDGAGDTRQIEDILVYSRRDNPAALRPQPGAPLARAGRSAGGRRPMSIYRIYNQDDIARLAGALPGEGRGWRSVIALAPGRKWITILDWNDTRDGATATRSLAPPAAAARRRLFAVAHTRRHQSEAALR